MEAITIIFLATVGLAFGIIVLCALILLVAYKMKGKENLLEVEEVESISPYYFEDKELGITMEAFPDGPDGQFVRWLTCPKGFVALTYGYPNSNPEDTIAEENKWNAWMDELGAPKEAHIKRSFMY